MGERILIIEDNVSLVDMLRMVLERRNYDVITTASGQEGLTLVRKKKPDLIILDIGLPDADGYDICREIKSEPKTREIKILMLTGKGTVEDVEKGFEVAADAYLPKPFDMERLILKIQSLLKPPEK